MPAARRGGLRLLAIAVLLIVVLAVAIAFSSTKPSVSPAGGRVAVEVAAVPLDPTDPARDHVGPLRYMGGLWMRSDDGERRFGGLSDVRVSADGKWLFSVSDCGAGVTASLSYDAAGRLVGTSDVQVVPLAGPGRTPGSWDAESLVVSDGLEVGFEGRARILSYRLDPPFAGPPRRLPMPEGVARCHSNEGLETMADVGGGRRLLVCEGRRNASGTVPAWVGRDGRWTRQEYPLLFDGGWGGEPFRPTGAARLPDGDVLVLERRFPPLAGRIVRLAGASLGGPGPLAPEEIARFEAPLTSDNFEGIDVRRDASGRTFVYLISDDNNCFKNGLNPMPQRTLLLMFALEG